jgi:hypothetical protein
MISLCARTRDHLVWWDKEIGGWSIRIHVILH